MFCCLSMNALLCIMLKILTNLACRLQRAEGRLVNVRCDVSPIVRDNDGVASNVYHLVCC